MKRSKNSKRTKTAMLQGRILQEMSLLRSFWDVPTFPVWRARREEFLLAVLNIAEVNGPAYLEARAEMIELIGTYPKYYKKAEILYPINPDSLVNPTMSEINERSQNLINLAKAMNNFPNAVPAFLN